ncbi:unnamed protein product [Amoebophrya sp. A120]|nr:unnamed protein product [Amoebophrya sp. A120]|eukprot:GSA120T00014245001.1
MTSSSSSSKKRLKDLQIDYEEYAIVAVYESGGEIKKKKMRLPRDFAEADITDLAAEVVEKCKYIPSSKVNEVERLLHEMARETTGGGGGQSAGAVSGVYPGTGPTSSSTATNPNAARPSSSRSRTADRGDVRSMLQQKNAQMQQQNMMPSGPIPPPPVLSVLETILPPASWAELDDYSDLLYEEQLPLKVKGAKSILRVCLEPRNLELISNHESLMPILSRELKENYKKSHDLSTAICCIFLCFSAFPVFHQVLGNFQCGDSSLRILEYESKRYAIRTQEREQYILPFLNTGQNVPPGGVDHQQQDASTSFSQQKVKAEKEEKKYQVQVLKQNKLLHTALHILLNLAEDIFIEKKMVNRGLVKMLCALLDRNMEELLYVALLFLKKLTIFEENKEVMAETRIVPRLVQLAQHQSAFIALLSLKVLFNLSFEDSVRSALAESGELFQQLVDLLKHPPFRQIVLKLLYQFTKDDRCKSLLTYHQDCMLMLLQLTIHFPDPNRVGKDLICLLVNLSLHSRAAELMVVCQLHRNNGQVDFLFPQLILRLLKTRDPMLCKVIRYVCSHQKVRELVQRLLCSDQVRMSRWLHEIMKLAQLEDPDLLLEVVGLLANLDLPNNDPSIPPVPWAELISPDYGLVDVLHRLLVVGFSEDDLVLESVLVVQLIAQNEEASQLLALEPKLLSTLIELLVEKQEDDDIILHLLFAFECMSLQDEIREFLLEEDQQLIPYVIDALNHKSLAVKNQARKTLDTLSLISSSNASTSPLWQTTWQERIKGLKFESHNNQWVLEISMLNHETSIIGIGEDEDYENNVDGLHNRFGNMNGHTFNNQFGSNSNSPSSQITGEAWEVENSLGMNAGGAGGGYFNQMNLEWDIQNGLMEREWS